MANQQLEELSLLGAIADTDEFLINDIDDVTNDAGGEPKRVLASTIRTYASAQHNAFSTFAADSGANVEADSSTDTITFAGGTGIATTATAGTDTITIALGALSNANAVVFTGGDSIPTTDANLGWDGSTLSVQNPTDNASVNVADFHAGNLTTPADDDEGYISFFNDDSTGSQVEFGRLAWGPRTALSTNKHSQFRWHGYVQDSFEEFASLRGAVNSPNSAEIVLYNNGPTVAAKDRGLHIVNHGRNVIPAAADAPVFIHKVNGTFQITKNLDWSELVATNQGWFKPNADETGCTVEVGWEGISLWINDTDEEAQTLVCRWRPEVEHRGWQSFVPIWPNPGSQGAPSYSFDSFRTSGVYYKDDGNFSGVTISHAGNDGLLVRNSIIHVGKGHGTTPQNATITGPYGQGTDQAGVILRIAVPLGTGAGAVGSLSFEGATAQVSGTTQHAAPTVGGMSADGTLNMDQDIRSDNGNLVATVGGFDVNAASTLTGVLTLDGASGTNYAGNVISTVASAQQGYVLRNTSHTNAFTTATAQSFNTGDPVGTNFAGGVFNWGNSGGLALISSSSSATTPAASWMVNHQTFTATNPAVLIDIVKSDGGTGTATCADDDLMFEINNRNAPRLSLYGDGDTQVFGNLAFQAGTVNTVTLTAAPSADRTLTLPNTTDTLVARDTVDTLQNKNISTSANTISASTTTQTGVAELATTAEIDTGTDTDRILNVKQFNDSLHGLKVIELVPFDWSTALATGDGKFYWRVPLQMDGMNLVQVAASLGAAQSTSGTPEVQIARLRAATPGGSRTAQDMLSTTLTIDANEWDSKDATTPAAINGGIDDVNEGDMLRIDVDTAGTGAQGLFVTLGFRKP